MKTLTLPEVVQGMTNATVRRWLKSPQQAVQAGEDLLELELSDSFLRLQADTSGTLSEVLAKEGATVTPGSPLARLTIGTSPATKTTPAAPSAQASSAKPSTSASGPAPSPASPSPPSPTGQSAGAETVIPILLPQVGNSMEEGTIRGWKVKEGERISSGQVLYEVETDKATIEVEATASGRLAKIVALEGVTVPIKTPVAYLAERDEAVAAWIAAHGSAPVANSGVPAPAAPAPTPARPEQASGTLTPASDGRLRASPAARRLAQERGLDLHSIGAGSGPGGRLLSTDLERALPLGGGRPGQPVRRPLAKMRKAIGKALQKSKQTVPHFYMRLTIDAGPLLAFYREQKPRVGCTLNDIILQACGRAIDEFPAFRSRLEGEEVLEYPGANIGVAVGVEDGLVVPVLLDVGRKDLARIAAESKELVESARKGRLQNVGQANFTISNLGMFGVEEFSAIINPPEAAILAVSAIREEVLVKDGALRPGRVMTLTLSLDHRLIDGLLAARFCARLKELLEALTGNK